LWLGFLWLRISKKLSGAPVEQDKRLGGAIAALRERGEFVG
jgi:hypothetical protein